MASAAWWLLSALALLMGLCGVSLKERLSVSTTDPIPENGKIFAVRYIIHNAGDLPLYDITTSCLVEMVESANSIRVKNSEISKPGETIQRLGPDDKDTKRFTGIGGLSSPPRGDITIVVTFRRAPWLWLETKAFPLRATEGPEGKWYWDPRSASFPPTGESK